jgi:hypothetical protein
MGPIRHLTLFGDCCFFTIQACPQNRGLQTTGNVGSAGSSMVLAHLKHQMLVPEKWKKCALSRTRSPAICRNMSMSC